MCGSGDKGYIEEINTKHKLWPLCLPPEVKHTHYHAHTNSSDGPPLLPEALLWQHHSSARTTTQVSLCDGHVQRKLKPDSQQDECGGSQNPLSHLYVCVYVCKSRYISSRSLLTACQSVLSPSFTSFVSLLLHLDPHIHPSLARPVPALLHHPDCSTFFHHQ